MAIIKCKMCGGDLNITGNETVAQCEYCGSTQTIPQVDNEKKLTLFARANRSRIGCEFDRAASVYESIVADFPEEAEAYWGLVLCKYGIEYVDDPATGKKVPTCHRSSFDSVLDDSNFELVMEYADEVARRVYREEAKAIEELRKGIIEVSGKEEPYDIFICYKETAPNGQRTIDSVLAQDVYDALTAKGYRVFFSRISLEDKLGQEYEPYIFAALNSAKIMLVFGTDYEYFNAVWVKNEWSRYLQLMARDKTKHLIPCYKGIDAYDMPKEFAKLQAQDMGKVGATQDLLRGIEKLLPREDKSASVVQQVVSAGGPSAMAMVRQGDDRLAVSDWSRANTHYEKALDLEPDNLDAIWGQLMVELHTRNDREMVDKFTVDMGQPAAEQLQAGEVDIDRQKNMVNEAEVPHYLKSDDLLGYFDYGFSYQSQYSGWNQLYKTAQAKLSGNTTWNILCNKADAQYKTRINTCLDKINTYYSQKIQESKNQDDASCKEILEGYETHLQDTQKRIQECQESALARREEDYRAAVAQFDRAVSPEDFEKARSMFRAVKICQYRDAEEYVKRCTQKAREIRQAAVEEAYNAAVAKFQAASTSKQFRQVKELFAAPEICRYKDSADYAARCDSEIARLDIQANDQKDKKVTNMCWIIAAITVVIMAVYVFVALKGGLPAWAARTLPNVETSMDTDPPVWLMITLMVVSVAVGIGAYELVAEIIDNGFLKFLWGIVCVGIFFFTWFILFACVMFWGPILNFLIGKFMLVLLCLVGVIIQLCQRKKYQLKKNRKNRFLPILATIALTVLLFVIA